MTATPPPALQVLIYDGTDYPPRPIGLPAGAARYLGPVTPATRLANDEWINIAITVAPIPTPPTSAALKVILDQDISSDWDDVGAIAVLHALADLGECQIIGMMVSSTNGASALCMDAINTYYGRPDIPIGVRPDVLGGGGYPGTIAAEFPHDLTSSAACPLAAILYRQLLSAADDHSVTIVTTGYLDNLQALLATTADSYSPLTGSALVQQKVKTLACMGGDYPSGTEFNFGVSAAATYAVVNKWPAGAVYSGAEIGSPIGTGGRLVAHTATTNPIRRVWQLHGGTDHPSYDQTAVYAAVRDAEGMWGLDDVGHNTTITTGANAWATDTDPTGLQDQSYLLERERSVVQTAIDTLMMAVPKTSGMTTSVPTAPTYLRATTVTASAVTLHWTKNSYNENGFTVEMGVNGVYSPAASVGAGVTTCTITGLPTTANRSFRVKATNIIGDSPQAYVWLYSGWTDVNFDGTGTSPSLYGYFRPCDLRWARGGNFRPNHVTINNDSTHGQNVTVQTDVGATGAQGSFYVYFFYQDANNWYRLNVATSTCMFEKKVEGVVTQVGASAPVTSSLGNGSFSQRWVVQCAADGALTYTMNGTAQLAVTDTLSFTMGKLGLGGAARTPLWENVNFVIG